MTNQVVIARQFCRSNLNISHYELRFPRSLVSLAPPPHFRSERLTARNDSYLVVENENIFTGQL